MPPKFDSFFFPPFSQEALPACVAWLNKQLLAQGQGRKEHTGTELPVMSPWCSPEGLAQAAPAFPRQRGAVVSVTGRAEISGSSPKDVGVVAGLGWEPLASLSQPCQS